MEERLLHWVIALPVSLIVKKRVLKTELKKNKIWARSFPLVGDAKYLLDLAHLSRAPAFSFASGALSPWGFPAPVLQSSPSCCLLTEHHPHPAHRSRLEKAQKVPKGDVPAAFSHQHVSPSPLPHPSQEHTRLAISSISTKLCTRFGFAWVLNAQGAIS